METLSLSAQKSDCQSFRSGIWSSTRGVPPGNAAAMDVFLNGLNGKVRDANHILWAGETVVPDAIEPAPALTILSLRK